MNESLINNKKTIKNIVLVTISNIFNIIAGILVGFLVPKILDIQDYGFYKTFTLYVGYVGLASLGIIDGIVLKYGGTDYSLLNREKFRSYFIWYLIIHSFITLLFLLISLFFIKGEYKVIFIFFGIDIICSNFTGYYQYISQITLRFKELSFRNIVKSTLTILGVLLLFLIHHLNPNLVNYRLYVIIILICNYILTLWYFITYKDISIGKHESIKKTFPEIVSFIKNGFPLSISLLCASLILTIDRQFVNLVYDTESYAIYAFAYNMLSLVTVATSAISTVIYPILKRTDEKSLKANYSKLIAIDASFVSLCLSAYFLLCGFINWFLPKYIESLPIFRVIFPGLVISSTITVVMHNYYKTLGKSAYYFLFSVIALLISIFANVIAYYTFGTMISISIASVITIFIWYIIVQIYLSKEYQLPYKKNTLFILLCISGFYLISELKNWIVGFFSFFLLIAFLVFVFNIDAIKKFLTSKIKHGEKNS